MKQAILVFCCVFYFFSCTTTSNSYRKKTSDHLNIDKGKIVQVSKVAEYKIAGSKVKGSHSGEFNMSTRNQSILLAKELALGNAIITAKCDFLINPQYDIKVEGQRILVRVEGYPANYTKFTTLTKSDTVIKKNYVHVPTSLDKVVEKKKPTPNGVKNKRVKRVKKHPGNTFYMYYGNLKPIGNYGRELNTEEDGYVNKYGGANKGRVSSLGFKIFRKINRDNRLSLGIENEYSLLALGRDEIDNFTFELRLGPTLSVALTEKIRVDFSYLLLSSIGYKEFYLESESDDLYYLRSYYSNKNLFNYGSVIKADLRLNKLLIGTSLSLGKEKMEHSSSASNLDYTSQTSRLSFYVGFAF